MSLHEKQNKHEVEPARILERHLKGLQNTAEDIRDFRMHASMGNTVLQQTGHHHGREDFAHMSQRFAEKIDPQNGDAKMYASVLGIIPPVVKAQALLNRRGIQDRNKREAKLQMVEFNNVLRTIIDTNPSIEPYVITGLMKSATLSYGYGAGEINMVVQETKDRLAGMKHELGFEAPLYYLPEGYEILETTSEDDKEGIDYKIRCPNGVIVTIDVKASQELADSAILKAEEFSYNAGKGGQMPKNKLIMFSGFTNEDFDPRYPWRAKPEAVERVYPTIEQALIEASGDAYTPAHIGVR